MMSEMISFPKASGLLFLKINEISHFTADNIYAYVHTSSSASHISISLKNIEKGLRKLPFCRIHKSYIINLNHIHCLSKQEGWIVILKDGTRFPVARSRRKQLIDVLGAFTTNYWSLA